MKKRVILRITCSILIIISIALSFQRNDVSSLNLSNGKPILNYVSHAPIYIDSDSDFIFWGFPGNGTVENPYIIEGYKITTSDSYGIYIVYTSKHFIIRNCYIDADDYGIYFQEIGENTAKIINNTCINNEQCGIHFFKSGKSVVANNTCINNRHGISQWYSVGSIVANNTCKDNDKEGIHLKFNLFIQNEKIQNFF